MASKTDPQATLQLSENARVVLERRYLAKDDAGQPIETPEGLFRRVANNIAEAERAYYSRPSTSSGRTVSESVRPEPVEPRRDSEEAEPSPLGRGQGEGGRPDADTRVAHWADKFYNLMTSLRFLPNSPTLGNAGRPLQQLSACFVLPVEDAMASIFETVKQTALIHQSGGGTGFSFSRLRPAGDQVQSTGGVASGPVSFMKVFDAATEAIKQGGTRRGANMAILDVRHPDIEAFIDVKADMVTLTNFNISVAVDEAFMQAVAADAEYDLVNPRTGATAGRRRARDVFDRIVANAWQNGDPGLVFLDRINAANPTPQLGRIEATNPCGEQPLLPYESCILGSLNLARFVRANAGRTNGGLTLRVPQGERDSIAAHAEALEGRRDSDDAEPSHLGRGQGEGGPPDAIDFTALGNAIDTAVRFLDNVIDMNNYPVDEIDRMTRLTRKLGLGVMGWADLLFQLGIAYDSEAALTLADNVMSFIKTRADAASEALATERGVFPAWPESIYGLDAAHPEALEGRAPVHETRPLRNATRTTVAPTGTLSIIADCSGGIEPAFALAFTRQHYLDPKNPTEPVRLTEVNHVFEAAARAGGWYSDNLVAHLASGGSLGERRDVPGDAKRLFVTSHDIAPEWHVRMQAAFQRHVDNAVSKTINFRRSATVDDVAEAYLLAQREGCKGITIYRDGSRAGQVLSHVAEGEADAPQPMIDTAHPEALEGRAPTDLSLSAPDGHAPRRRNNTRALNPVRPEPVEPRARRGRYVPPRPALPLSEVDTVHPCLDCGNPLVFSEGCLVCRSCGYTRCG